MLCRAGLATGGPADSAAGGSSAPAGGNTEAGVAAGEKVMMPLPALADLAAATNDAFELVRHSIGERLRLDFTGRLIAEAKADREQRTREREANIKKHEDMKVQMKKMKKTTKVEMADRKPAKRARIEGDEDEDAVVDGRDGDEDSDEAGVGPADGKLVTVTGRGRDRERGRGQKGGKGKGKDGDDGISRVDKGIARMEASMVFRALPSS